MPRYSDGRACEGNVHGIVKSDGDKQGCLAYRFLPDDPMNRSEVAKIIALAREVMQ